MPRFFNLLEAEGLLPEVRRLVRGLIEYKSEFDEAAEELILIAQRITIMGGIIPPHDKVKLLRNRKNAAVRASKTAFEQLQQRGCVLQDLGTGQVDFPTLYRGQEVCLSWKMGEAAIEFWHHPDEDGSSRKAIDSEFLKNHRGEE